MNIDMDIILYLMSTTGLLIAIFVIGSAIFNIFQYSKYFKSIITGVFISVSTLLFNFIPFYYKEVPIFDLRFLVLIITAIFFDKLTLLVFGPIFIILGYFSDFSWIFLMVIFVVAVILKWINIEKALGVLLFIAIPPIAFSEMIVNNRIPKYDGNLLLTICVIIAISIAIVLVVSFIGTKSNFLGFKMISVYFSALLSKYKTIYTFKIDRKLEFVKTGKGFTVDFDFDDNKIKYKDFASYFKMAVDNDFNVLEHKPKHYFLITPKKGKEKNIIYFCSKRIFGGFRGYICDDTNYTAKIDLTSIGVKRDYVTGLNTYAVMKETVLEKAKISTGLVLFVRMQIDVNFDKESIYDIDFEIDCYKYLAELLKKSFPNVEFYYIKNNEFQMVVYNIEKSANAISYVKNLKFILSEKHEIITKKISFNCFFGVYYCESLKLEKITNVTAALEKVTYSKYKAIHIESDNVYYFNEEEYNNYNKQLYRSKFLPSIILNGDFELNYQPVVNSNSGKIFAYEVLIKVNHSFYETTTDFINDCFVFGYDVELDNQIVKKVLKTIKEGEFKNNLFINLLSSSPITNDIAEIQDILHNKNKQLFIEFTEHKNNNMDELMYKISKVKNCGAKVVVNYYGVGFSTNSVVSRISPDFIKINMEFIKDINHNKRKEYMVDGIINYCKKLNILSIAEGIESEEEMQKVISLGIDYLQCYYLRKPIEEYAENEIIEPVRLFSDKLTNNGFLIDEKIEQTKKELIFKKAEESKKVENQPAKNVIYEKLENQNTSVDNFIKRFLEL